MNYKHDADNDSRTWDVLAILAVIILVGPTSLAMAVALLSWVCGMSC